MSIRRCVSLIATTATGLCLVAPLAPAANAATPATSVHVVASQGPTDPNHHYVLVTWDRPAGNPTAYDVVRDGTQIGTVTRTGDPSSANIYRDSTVASSHMYTYAVRAHYADGSTSALSPSTSVYVRSGADLGGGRTFAVDSQAGSSDLAKAQAAVNAAIANHGGVVLFSARTYVFSGTLNLTNANNVVLRGAGMGQTILKPGFAGDSSSCSNGGILVNFYGSQASLSSTHLTANVPVGARTVTVGSVAQLKVGQRIVFNQPAKTSSGSILDFVTPKDFAANGIMEDPGTGRDDRKRWDANEITGISGNTVTFRYPFSQAFTTAVPLTLMSSGDGNGIEQMTIQGRSSTEQTFYRLVNLKSQSHFVMADVEERWANRNYLLASGYDISVVGFRGQYADPNTATATCRYKISVYQTANFSFIGGVMGGSGGINLSFLTTQSAQRTLVRGSRFVGSQSYAFNEHGQGSRDYVFENNYVGNTTGDGGVALGNTQWGFSGNGVVQNNTFENNSHDVNVMENSYGVVIANNVMRNASISAINGYTWAGPFTSSSNYGSARWYITGNTITGAYRGIVLGNRSGGWYPYTGVKDVVVSSNSVSSRSTAISLAGDSSTTSRFQVFGNSGTNAYVHPGVVSGDYWAGNADGASSGSATSESWAKTTLPWEG
jgi:hypothetical protein